jgi:hypothetical protein
LYNPRRYVRVLFRCSPHPIEILATCCNLPTNLGRCPEPNRKISITGRQRLTQNLSGTKRWAALLLVAILFLVGTTNAVLITQNLEAAPQVNVAVQGQTGAQPEGRS